MADAELERACGEIARRLLESPDPGRGLRALVRGVCAKYSLGRLPANSEILASAGPGRERLRRVLLKKPAKTASGVAVVALMPAPYACPHGRCTYCPGGIQSNTPNSYTGSEPVTLGAVEAGYDPAAQITAKIRRLEGLGHDPSKTELVIVGGTFLFMPAGYRERFVRSCFDALNGRESADVAGAMRLNERAAVRNVGLTIETKPDYCRREHVDWMLAHGVTRIEIGVQSLREEAYRAANRGHTYRDVTESFQVSRDAGYKIVSHMMPGLPGATPDGDIEDFGRLFDDPELRPDMLKIYPTLVTRGTPLHDEYAAGRYAPYTDPEMVRVLAEAKKRVPKWVRIMRVQREIRPADIVAGPRAGNLRQLVHERLAAEGAACRCIRCREAGTRGGEEPVLDRVDYDSSGGREAFLSFEDSGGSIYGFARLRRPGPGAHRPEARGACIVRELHVYGRSLGLGEREEGGVQHSGLGRRLMAEAERVSREEWGARRLLVISAAGTRGYYRRLGYSLYGPYMARDL